MCSNRNIRVCFLIIVNLAKVPLPATRVQGWPGGRNSSFFFRNSVTSILDFSIWSISLYTSSRARIVSSPEILSVCHARHFLQQVFINLHFHVLVLQYQRGSARDRGHIPGPDADGVNPDAIDFCYFSCRKGSDGAGIVLHRR